MKPSRAVFFESLEMRCLLSSSVAHLTPQGFTPAQIQQAYSFNQINLTPGPKTIAKPDGRGQTIAIVTAYRDPNIASDLRTFDKMFGIPNQVPHGGFALSIAAPNGRPAIDPSWAQETSLDVEWAHAMAPGAKILLVEAKSQSASDLFNAVDFARKKRGVSVVSMSWGWDTAPLGVDYQDILTTPPRHVAGLSSGDGVTFVMSAGDSGAANSWPDSSVNVVSVGGTTLSVDANGNYASEVPLAQSAQDATVDYNADPNPGYAVYDSLPFQGQQGWQIGSGTSAGAPQWAALIAISNQGRALDHKHSLDGEAQTLPTLETAPSTDFHIITGAASTAGRGSPFADRVITTLINA